MPRYDVHDDASGGFLLDVQSDLLAPLSTRVVVPLIPRLAAPPPADRLNPVFSIAGSDHVMVTQYLAAVETRELGPVVDSLSGAATEITDALDMLFHGF